MDEISSYSNLWYLLDQKVKEVQLATGNLRCQEVCIVFSSDLCSEIPSRELVLVALWTLLCQLVRLFLQQTQSVGLVDLLALGSCHVVANPLPKLAAGDFRRSSILLHQLLVLLAIFFSSQNGSVRTIKLLMGMQPMPRSQPSM